MRKKHLILSLIVLTLGGAIQAAPPLADRLPSQCIAYLGWGGANDALKGSGLGQLAQDPAIRTMVQTLWETAIREASRQTPQAGELLKTMPPALYRSPVALSLTRLAPQDEEVGLVLAMDVGNARPEVEAWYRKIFALMEADGPKLREKKSGETVIWSFATADDPAVSFFEKSVRIGFHKGLFFLIAGDDAMQAFLEAGPEKSLASSASFQAAMKEVDGPDVQIASYADLAAIFTTMTPPADRADEPGPARLFKALGLDGVTTWAATTRIVKGRMLTRARLASPAPHRGVLSMLAGPVLGEAEVARLPYDADLALAGRLSPPAILETLQAAARQIAGSDEVALLHSLGDSVAISTAASQGGFLTGTVVSLAVKDEQALKTQLDKIEQFLIRELSPRGSELAGRPMGPRKEGLQLLTVTGRHAQVNVRYVQIVGRDFIPVAPAWCVHEGRLHVAAWPQALLAALDQPAGAKRASLAANESFAELRSQLSPKASMLAYVNTPALTRRAYSFFLPLWTMAANKIAGEGPVEALPEWLPALPALEKHLGPQMTAISSDEAGVVLESIGPVPEPTIVAVPVLATLLSARFAERPGRSGAALPVTPAARRAAEMNQMRQILIALIASATDNSGQFPDSLDSPTFASYLDEKLKASLLGSDLKYLGKGHKMQKMEKPSKTVLLYVIQGGQAKALAGFGDGHVEVVDVEKLKAMIP